MSTATPSGQSEESIYEDARQNNEEVPNELALVRSGTIDPAVVTTTQTVPSDLNIETVVENPVERSDVPLCRICWSDGTNEDLTCLPCKCQGTVGNVHATCLKEWERVRRTRRCEICKEVYLKQRGLLTMLRSFFQYRYAGIFFLKLTNITATALIAYANIVLGEMNISYLMANGKASANKNGLSYPVMIISAAILPYFVVNFLAVDFAMTELIECCQLFRDWWYDES